MSDVNERLDGFTRKYLKKYLRKQIQKDPKLKTNPRMAEWFTLGFYAGATAQGEAINLIIEMAEPPRPVADDTEEKDGEDTENVNNVT